MERLKRFEHCAGGLFDDIKNVLNQLHPDKKETFLSDEYLQVVSSDRSENSFQVTFSRPVKSIIYLNVEKIKTDAKKEGFSIDEYFKYAIGHEIGHYFTADSWLLEKEANVWLKKWGNGNFNKLIEKIDHEAPKLEEEGYKDGCDWAKMVDDKNLLDTFGSALEALEKAGSDYQEKSIIKERIKNIIFNHFKNSNELENDKWNESHLNGFSFGVIQRVQEIVDKH